MPKKPCGGVKERRACNDRSHWNVLFAKSALVVVSMAVY